VNSRKRGVRKLSKTERDKRVRNGKERKVKGQEQGNGKKRYELKEN
jgi:hypothetical protein